MKYKKIYKDWSVKQYNDDDEMEWLSEQYQNGWELVDRSQAKNIGSMLLFWKFHFSYIFIKKEKYPTFQQFSKIGDLRQYLLLHPDQAMVETACLHYLGDEVQEFYHQHRNITSSPTCKKCGGETIPSKGYSNAYTEPTESGLVTVLPGKGDLIDCLKCKDCGHSFVPANP